MGERVVMAQATSTIDALTQACLGITQQLGPDDPPMLAFHIVVLLIDGTTLVAEGETLA